MGLMSIPLQPTTIISPLLNIQGLIVVSRINELSSRVIVNCLLVRQNKSSSTCIRLHLDAENTDNSLSGDDGGFPLPVPVPMRIVRRAYVRNTVRVPQLPADDVNTRRMSGFLCLFLMFLFLFL